jgi:hypothetical protein
MASADDSLEAVIGFAMRGDAKALQVRVATVSNCLDLFETISNGLNLFEPV